jgi:hypothetical protein
MGRRMTEWRGSHYPRTPCPIHPFTSQSDINETPCWGAQAGTGGGGGSTSAGLKMGTQHCEDPARSSPPCQGTGNPDAPGGHPLQSPVCPPGPTPSQAPSPPPPRTSPCPSSIPGISCPSWTYAKPPSVPGSPASPPNPRWTYETPSPESVRRASSARANSLALPSGARVQAFSSESRGFLTRWVRCFRTICRSLTGVKSGSPSSDETPRVSCSGLG